MKIMYKESQFFVFLPVELSIADKIKNPEDQKRRVSYSWILYYYYNVL